MEDESVFRVVLSILLMAYLFCSVYCRIKKIKSDFRGVESVRKNVNCDKVEENQGNTVAELSIRNRVVTVLYRISDNVIRVMLFITGYIPSHHIRDFLYRNIFMASLGKKVVMYYGAEIRAPWNLYIDDGAIIGDKAILDARRGIYIGKNVNLSTGVWIWTLQHKVNSPSFETEGAPVYVEDSAWISCRATVLPGVTIAGGGLQQMVCAKNTDEFGVYGGVPCKKIGERNQNLTYEFQGSHMHML